MKTTKKTTKTIVAGTTLKSLFGGKSLVLIVDVTATISTQRGLEFYTIDGIPSELQPVTRPLWDGK